MRPRLTAIAPTVGEVVRYAGGWLFDQVMVGWDVTVITAECADPRALHILGVRPRELDAILTSPNLGRCLDAIAVLTDLYDSDERVRQMVLAAAEAGDAEVRLWGDVLPVDFDASAGPISHTLSLAARAFKAHAMAAASLPAETAADTEVFRRGEIRRGGLVAVR